MEKTVINTAAGPVERKCATCAHYVADPVDPSTLQSVKRCRRFPPSITVMPTPQGIMQASAWPNPHPEAWCYEWQAVPTKIAN